MSTLNLSKLKEGNNLKIPENFGSWEGLNQMEPLIEGLDVGEDQLTLDQVKSVPTLWGRVATFEDALIDLKHQAHGDAVKKWRALLALVLLRNDQSYPGKISIKTVDLNPTASPNDKTFFDIIKQQRPRTTLELSSGSEGWSKIRLIRYRADNSRNDDMLVGALSPATICVPVRSPSLGALPYPWMTPDLVDPLSNKDWLTPDQLNVLFVSVGRLIQTLHDSFPVSPIGKRLASAVMVNLQSYHDDLRAAGADAAISQVSLQPDAQFMIDIGQADFLNALSFTHELKPTDDFVSDCKIVSNIPHLDSIVDEILLADLGYARTVGKDANRISLLGSDMLGGAKTFNQIKSEALSFSGKRLMILTPDDIFSEYFTPLEEVNAQAHPDGFKQSLLPLKPAVLLFMSPQDLLQNLKVTGDHNRRVAVSLKITICDRWGESFQHEITKVYMTSHDGQDPSIGQIISDGEYSAERPISAAAWPDFHVPYWKQNYFMSESVIALSPYATSGVSSQMIVADLSMSDKMSERMERLDLWSRADGRWGDPLDKAQSRETADWVDHLMVYDGQLGEATARRHKILQRCDFGFEAAVFSIPPQAALDKTKGSVYAGLALLPRVNDVYGNVQTAKIAIDYGTTNTMIIAELDGEKMPVEFKPRLRKFNQSEKEAAKKSYQSFMPSTEVKQPFTTVLQLRRFELHDRDAEARLRPNDAKIMWRDYAYFDDEVSGMLRNVLDRNAADGTLEFGLKWATDRAQLGKVERYIGHLALLTMAELVAKGAVPDQINWYFSYPMALRQRGNAYRNLIKGSLSSNIGVSPLTEFTENNPGNLYFVTESDAAVAYFEHVGNALEAATVLLDIGGGTTDIGVQYNGQAKWRDSIKIAGADLMTNFIAHHRTLVEDLKLTPNPLNTSQYEEFLNGRFIADPQNTVNKAINALVNSRQFKDSFESEMRLLGETPSIRKLQAGAFLMLGGLLYYTGLQLSKLAAKKDPDINVNNFDNVAIAFAGRGSSLFKVLYDNFGRNGSFSELSRMLYAGVKTEDKSYATQRFYFAEEAKHEAAAGMLHLSDGMIASLKENAISRDAHRVLGLDITIKENGKDAVIEHRRSVQDLEAAAPDHNMIVEVMSDEFLDFLVALREIGKVNINIAEALTDIQNRVKRSMQNAINPALDEFDLQSMNAPFMEMLKETMRRLYAGEGVTATWED